MSVGKIVKTEFFIYLNKELYKIVHSWEEFKTVKAIMDMFCTKITTEHPELPPFNIKETVEKLSSDEFIETKIKNVLE